LRSRGVSTSISPKVAAHRVAGCAIARVRRTAALLIVLGVAEVFLHLDFKKRSEWVFYYALKYLLSVHRNAAAFINTTAFSNDSALA
jgi:hypothetical protein